MSYDEKDMVDVALSIVDSDAADAGDFFGRQHAVDQTLAGEVRRLRAYTEEVIEDARRQRGDLEFQLKDAAMEIARLRVVEQRLEIGQRSIQHLDGQVAARNRQLADKEAEIRLILARSVFDPVAVRALLDAVGEFFNGGGSKQSVGNAAIAVRRSEVRR